jgi:ankyrin repeat protein
MLCWHASQGNNQAINDLLSLGVDANQSTHQGRTAMHLAAAHGHLETMDLLMDNKAEI